ncbi:MAG TPA: HDOD domain-containing protein [Solirubrobacteraceae bacterium]|nr:HDOD domain-containing protein [Solirubrobacteraceae bacterium]
MPTTRGVTPQRESLGDSLTASQRPLVRTPRTDRSARLTVAFQALEEFPALAEARNRLLAVITDDHHSTADVISTVESDVALITAVLRLANSAEPGRERTDTVVGAVELLRPHAIQALASRVRTFDFFERASIWGSVPERLRLHALATQRAADRIAAIAGYANRDRLAVTSLLHDIGKLALIHAHPGYPAQVHKGARTPEERIHQERRELGVDHALVGGVLIRRWRLPASLATPIEHHHNPDAEGEGEGEAAIIRLADMLAHYEQGARVSPSGMLHSARAVGLGTEQLRQLMHEPPGASQRPRQRHLDPNPLSKRQLAMLEQLAKGSTYNQIAHDLALSVSTVRTHLHNIYGKLGVADRTQAVLTANERGWLSALAWLPPQRPRVTRANGLPRTPARGHGTRVAGAIDMLPG